MVEQTLQTNTKEIAALFAQISRQLSHLSLPRWLELDLTFQQMRVLYLLKHYGPQKMSELSERLNVSMPTITGIVSRLIERKDGPALVSRLTSPEDRRQVWAHLTQEGSALTEQLEDFKESALTDALDKLTISEIEEVRRGFLLVYSTLIQQRNAALQLETISN